MPEQKPRTSLPFIVHQADLMAARIEFEREWLPKFKAGKSTKSDNFTLTEKKSTKPTIKTKTLANVQSEGLMNLLNNI